MNSKIYVSFSQSHRRCFSLYCTHTHTVLVHDNQYANYCNTDTQSDTSHTTNIRLVSVHVLRTKLQVSMGSAAGGQPPPDFGGKFFNIIRPPPDFGGFYCEIFNSIIKF